MRGGEHRVAGKAVARRGAVSVGLALLLVGLWSAAGARKAGAEEFRLERTRLRPEIDLASRPLGYGMAGTIRLGELTCEAVLLDYDRDGVYGTVSGPRADGRLSYGDQMVLTAAIKGGKRAPLPEPKSFFVGKYVELGGRFFHCDIARDGSRVSITEAEAPLGRLRPAHGRFWIQLIAPEVGTFELYAPHPDADKQKIPLEVWANSLYPQEDGSFQVPAGQYYACRWGIKLADARGVEWHYEVYDFTAGRPLTVRAGETTELSFGPPLRAKLTSQGDVRAGSSVDLSLALSDRAGRQISSITRNGELPTPPTLRIVDAGGREVHTGSFRWG